ncbi:PMS1 protein homolog 1 isoform X2 [Zootoca vivipara]|uniref:PMS1 protein homolog 1 isoform X2 n=1 Tax=Zootoca vivipara TaxID=8524 RepID=UPI00293C0898|nr:PMS1 protein homolog 1 isoform X2 [Zootoca vivipara]
MKQLAAETIRLVSSSQENYGFDKIEIRDNGDGIKAADVPVAAVKHYTSKISSSEDLEKLATYGFRGEALGSICSMSEVLITTKTASDDFSTQYLLDRSGHVTSQKPSHLGQGTTVTVLKLFKNLPVRKQFYSTDKKRKEEIKKIQKLLMAYGIIKPELRITFTHNKTIMWQKTRVSDHKMAFMAVVGTAVMSGMVPFQHHSEDPEVFLSGFLPKPSSDGCLTSHSSAERSFIFVNNRPVHQKEILKLVQQYYNLKSHKDSNRSHPAFFINIAVPPSAVDVNLTPDKSQVFLHNKESVCLAVENVLTSVYGPLPGTASCETDLSGATSGEAEQMNVSLNEVEPRNIDPHACTELISFSNAQNGGTEKPTEVCLETQMLYSAVGLSTKNELSGCKTAVSDRFLCEHQQNKSKVIFNLDGNTLMDTNSKNGLDDDLRDDHFQEAIERTTTLKDSTEVTADKWSLGNAFKNTRGENIEPVRILIPEMGHARPQERRNDDGQQTFQEGGSIQSLKKTNVVNDKLGQITAYDIIKNRIIKKAMSAFDIFTQDHRPRLLAENTKVSMEELMLKLKEMWETLNEEEKKKYEEKANRDFERYNKQSRKAADQSIQRSTRGRERKHKSKLKDCLINQQKLDKLFHSQMEEKPNSCKAIKIVQVPFSMDSFRHNLHVLKQKETVKDDPCLIRLPNFPDAWIIASEKKIMMLNPYRVEEALLFKKLLENHKLPIQKLDNPIILTDSLFSDSRYKEVLCNMPKESIRFDGSSYLSDTRLTANGFQIKIIPAIENQLEIEGMANCLPYYGIPDLKEILSAVVDCNAKEVHECRPLKVTNYLEAKAVRLCRQLPLYISKEDVQDTIHKMETQLGNQHKGCVHGRPFLHYLTDIPE